MAKQHKYSFITEGATALQIVDNDTLDVVDRVDAGNHFGSWTLANKRRAELEGHPAPSTEASAS